MKACGFSVLGPTLPSMGRLLASDTAHMALALAGVRGGYFLGAVLCALLFPRIPLKAEIQFIGGCLLVSIMMGVAPWVASVDGFITSMVVIGTGLGYIDAGNQPYLLNLWHGHRMRNSLLQSVHFSWSVASTILPYLISFFLSDIPTQQALAPQNTSSTTYLLPNGEESPPNRSSVILSSNASEVHHSKMLQAGIPYTTNSDAVHDEFQGNATFRDEHPVAVTEGGVRWAYVFLASIMLLCTFFITLLHLLTRHSEQESFVITIEVGETSANNDSLEKGCSTDDDKLMSNRGNNTAQHKADVNNAPPRSYRGILLVFFFMFAFLYQCVEGIPGGFLTTFCARGLGWSLEDGALITTMYWGAQSCGRLLSMLTAWIVSPRAQISVNLLLVSTGYTLLQFVERLGPVSVWVAVGAAGLGVGSTLPTGFLWLADYVGTVTETVAAVGLAGTALAGVLVLALTGFLFDRYGPMTMVYTLGVSGLVYIAVFASMQIWASYGLKCYGVERTDNKDDECHDNEKLMPKKDIKYNVKSENVAV